jgi:hypothetical protein
VHLTWRNSTANGINALDFLVTEPSGSTYYLSSLTSTPLTWGVAIHRLSAIASAVETRFFEVVLTGLDAGLYTITPYWRVSTGTGTVMADGTYYSRFSLEEYGLSS